MGQKPCSCDTTQIDATKASPRLCVLSNASRLITDGHPVGRYSVRDQHPKPFGPPSDVHKFKGCRGEFVGPVHLGELIKPLVRHGYHADIRLYSAKGIVCRLRPGVCQSVKQGTLSYIRKPHHTKLHLYSSKTQYPPTIRRYMTYTQLISP